MKRILLLMLLLITAFQGFSQTRGISYQAVILSPKVQEIPGINAQGNILANTAISIQFTVINSSNNEEYHEKHSTRTDSYGMINLLIGNGTPTGSNDFSDILWNGTVKKLKVGIDFTGGNNFSPLSEQNLTYMPQPPTQETTQLIDDNAAAIEAETTRAKLAEQTNATAIVTERTRATTAEIANTTAIEAEKTRATTAEQANTTAIEAEKTRATTAEQANTTAIEAEKARAIAAEQANTTAIEAEKARAIAAEEENIAGITDLETLANGKIYLGNANNIATEVTLTGDVTINNAGVSTIGASKVLSTMIADATIVAQDIASDAVTTAKILNANVTTAKIADANITNAKLDKTNIPLSGFGAAASDVALGANKLTGVANPTSLQDAATKNYVDTQITGINALADGKIYLGNASNEATQVTLTGDVTFDNAGKITIGASKVVSTMIADATIVAQDIASDAVTTAKILDGTILNADVSATAAIAGTKITPDFGTQNLATTGNASVGGTLAVAGVTTLTAQPILSSLTASQAVFTDASKGLVSVPVTGTGNVVLAASPTLTGTPLAPTATAGTNTTQIATTAFVTTALSTVGLANFTESTYTNSLKTGVKLLATNIAANVDAVLSPKGTGALSAQQPDDTLLGGNNRGDFAVDFQMSRDLNTQVASGDYAVIVGGENNTASGYASFVGGYINNASEFSSSVVGGANNKANAYVSAVVGGQYNTASGQYSFIGGGQSNTALSAYTFSGGYNNTAQSYGETVLGLYATVGAGTQGYYVATDRLFVIGNGNSTARRDALTILKNANTTVGGSLTVNGNGTSTSFALPAGRGTSGQVLTTDGAGVTNWATAGLTNFTESNYEFNTKTGVKLLATNAETNVDVVLSPIGSGALLAQQPDGTTSGGNNRGGYAVDFQMKRNDATQVASGDYAVIVGGSNNIASGWTSIVGGGTLNTAGGGFSFVGAGSDNKASADLSFVGGGYFNTASGIRSFVGGGYSNTANASYSSVGGGASNLASGANSFVGGGSSNTASGLYSSVVGGQINTASGLRSSVVGGYQSIASGEYSSVVGGQSNTASGDHSFIVGGYNNTAGGNASVSGGTFNTAQSFGETVLGLNATVGTGIPNYYRDYDRLFVIGNGVTQDSRSNALTILKNGHATFAGSVTATSHITSSDLRLKRNIVPLQNSVQALMQLNPVSYEKKNTLASTDYSIKENGFIAQEIREVFPTLVNESLDSDKLLSVNYTALIPVLTKAIQEQQKEIEALKAMVEQLLNQQKQ